MKVTRRENHWRIKALLALFCFGAFYFAINIWILRSIGPSFFLALQALGCLAIIWASGRWGWRILFHFLMISAAFNIGYGLVMDDAFSRPTFFWVVEEIRQSSSAAGQFSLDFILTTVLVIGLAALLAAVRRLRCAMMDGSDAVARRYWIAAWALFLLPSLLVRLLPLAPIGAERNLFEYFADWLVAPPPPARQPVTLPLRSPQAEAHLGLGDKPLHILWIIDESVAASAFQSLYGAKLQQYGALDYGAAQSMANCSAPSHVALRSGVDVRAASAAMDLRATPSIWGYAKAAGYRTYMLDGQHDGAPQNFLYAPEAALIDDYRSVQAGVDTDRALARRLNLELKSAQPSFGYVLLRGVHFPYAANVPEGLLSPNMSNLAQYHAGLAYSKYQFFETLLQGIDRQKVAIIYTADHGQNLARPDLPHCSKYPAAAEYEVPFVTFLPEAIRGRYIHHLKAGRSASQIFPATLIWMGFERTAVEQSYDFDLNRSSARPLRFGRAIIPVAPDAAVDVRPALR